MENNTLCNRHSLGVNNHTKMYVTYTRIYGWSDYGGESSYQPGYRLENMMWMTLLVYDYIIPEEKVKMRKKILVSLLIAVSVTCFSGCGSSSDQGSNTKEEVVTKKDADEKNEDDVTFDYYELDDGTLEIEGYDNEDKAKIVEIPDTIDEKKVSVLNRYLFSNEVVEEIILPESLKIIEDQAFYGAIALRKLEINGIETMGDYCIYECPKIKEVRLPEGLKELGERSIENCESLTDIYLPSTLETIDEYNFDLCADGLKIHVPAGSNTETLVRKVIENLEYNVEVVPE